MSDRLLALDEQGWEGLTSVSVMRAGRCQLALHRGPLRLAGSG